MSQISRGVVVKGAVVLVLVCGVFLSWRSRAGIALQRHGKEQLVAARPLGQEVEAQLSDSDRFSSSMRKVNGVLDWTNSNMDEGAEGTGMDYGENAPDEIMDRSLAVWLEHGVHTQVMKDKNYFPLTTEQVQAVEKFVFFTGYPRSGHSIFGSFMDAHPNIALSYAFFLFRHLLEKPGIQGSIDSLLKNKTLFFNAIYERSYRYSVVSGAKDGKGYTLDVPGSWSGKFDHLRVIGDKSALPTSLGYSTYPHTWFKSRYECLQERVALPLLGIHIVRNPFDMISTHTLYKGLGKSWKSDSGNNWTAENQYRNEKLQKKVFEFYFDKAKAVKEMVPLCGMRLLEVHNEDMVQNPRRELLRMCEFLEVECPESYLQACESKAYKQVSRTRDIVYWPAELRAQVEANMKEYSFFRGYTFEDDYYNPS